MFYLYHYICYFGRARLPSSPERNMLYVYNYTGYFGRAHSVLISVPAISVAVVFRVPRRELTR